MTRLSCGLLLLGLVAGAGQSFGAPEPPEPARVEALAKMLPAERQGVGRPIDDRAAWEPLAQSKAARGIIREAERLIGKPLPEVTDELYLEYSRNGNRSRCQRVLGDRRGRLPVLVLAECLENRGRFIPELERVILALCDQKSWVLPAHDRNLSNFKGTQMTVDLASSAMGWEMALADYWLGARLSPKVRRRIDEELQRRVFGPYELMITRGKPRMWWLTGTNNWNAVCLANVTGAALAQLDSPQRRALYVASAEKYIQYFLKGFTSDGYCSEGIGYWNYGFGHFVLLAETLRQATGGELDLMADPRVEPIARFGRRMEIAPGVYPSFADCSLRARPAPWIEWYVSRCFGFGWPEGRSAAGPPAQFGDLSGTGLFFFPHSLGTAEADVTEAAEKPLRAWFPEAGILIARARPGTKPPFGVALKGGHNAEHHNHNDVGSFVVVLGDQTPLVDPGSEVYTRRTFSSRRYDSGVLNSWGHPVPRVAGRLQRTGRSAAADVLSTEFTDETDTLVLDLKSAYKVKSLEKLTRSFVYSRRGKGSLEVTDRVEFSTPESFGTALITFDDWQRVAPDTLEVGTGKGTVVVRIDTGGVPFSVKAEAIDEDVRAKRKPTRIGIDLDEPVASATLRLTIRPAQ